MGKLVFAGVVLLLGLALYGVARRHPRFAALRNCDDAGSLLTTMT